MVDMRKIKPKAKKKSTKPKPSTKDQKPKKKPVDWAEILRAVLEFTEKCRNDEYAVLSICEYFIIISKRIKMTELIKNDNNIFQPKETFETRDHYKYFYLINPEENKKDYRFDSPKYYPTCSDSALHYMVNFR